MSSVEWPEPVALAQRFIPNDGNDLKLYCIGDEVWAVRKPSPLILTSNSGNNDGRGRAAKAELVPLTKELEKLGRRLGRLFGLELYGVDCVESPEGPLVIEVNEFPNYTGVPDANLLLAEYVTRAQKQRTHL
jgi:glutathione synthase/RimK-type ligase-like ATP-grasp enzyme